MNIGDTINDGSVVWTVSKDFSFKGGNFSGRYIGYKDNNGKLYITGSDAYAPGYHGGTLELYGENYEAAERRGGFNLFTVNNGVDGSRLMGLPDKSLTWAGNDLAGSAIVSQSLGTNGYTKYANGIIMQWGSISVPSANTNITINFPISFTSVFKFVALPFHNGSLNTYPVVIDVYHTPSSVAIKSSIAISQSLEWFAIGY